jgi:organic radical activating enzyme
MKGRISEVFESVQGEGLYLGESQIFVRFFGCNLNCKFCDTSTNNFLEYEPQELFEEIKSYGKGYHSVSFTGGEPLLQNEFLKKILRLNHQEGYRNYLETNGTLTGELRDVIDDTDFIAMDFKLPSSAEMVNVWGMHRRFLKVASQKEVFVKMVICESSREEDLREALKIIREVNAAAIVILQPNYFEKYHSSLIDKIKNFRDICWQEKITACVIPQMHKIVGLR